MIHQIDCHILQMPESNKNWLSQCLRSLDGMPVNIRLCDGIAGHLGKARAKAIEMDSSEFVTWVDHDDMVLSDYFSTALEVFKKHSDITAVYPQTLIFNSDDSDIEFGFYPTRDTTAMFLASHGIIFRRSAIEKILYKAAEWPWYFDKVIKCHAALYGKRCLLHEIGYAYRRHDAQMSKIHKYPEYAKLKKEVYANVPFN